MSDWRWDAPVNRYRDAETGRFLSRDAALEFVNQSVRESINVTGSYAASVAGGKMSPGDWEQRMRDEIKGEYIRQYLLGHGGRETMSKSDWGKIGSMIKEQYTYLKGFANEVAAGNLTDAQIAQRSAMYINSGREAFEKANALIAKKAGYIQVHWNVDPSVENCEDCLAFEAMGWANVEDDPYDGAVPGSGETQCLTNCHCELEYSNPDNGEDFWAGE
jgi:hypothetical protein